MLDLVGRIVHCPLGARQSKIDMVPFCGQRVVSLVKMSARAKQLFGIGEGIGELVGVLQGRGRVKKKAVRIGRVYLDRQFARLRRLVITLFVKQGAAQALPGFRAGWGNGSRRRDTRSSACSYCCCARYICDNSSGARESLGARSVICLSCSIAGASRWYF